MSHKLVSIIIPTYNRGNVISKTLESILLQTYLNWECIIVDDGSTDTTKNVVADFISQDSRFIYILRPNNRPKGANTCRNFGFDNANGDYVLFFDSDDLMDPNALENYISSFNESIDAVVAPLKINRNNQIKYNTINSNNVFLDYFTGKITYYVSGPIWRKFFLQKQDYLFDEKVSNLDDWDFNLRMLYAFPNLKLINQPSFTYIINENSLSHEIEKLNIFELKSELNIRNKHYAILKKLIPLQKKDLLKYLVNRNLYLLRLSLVNNSKTSKYLFFNLFKILVQSSKILYLIKYSVGYLSMKWFNKGYSLFKF